MLMLGRAEEARATLEEADKFWRGFDPENPWAAEAGWWFGKALVAAGEPERGEEIMKEMRPRLVASWMPSHRALAAGLERRNDGT